VRIVNRKGLKHIIMLLTQLHTDFWGPYSVPSLYESLYFISFIDKVTYKTWVFFTKDKVFIRAIFIKFKA
jgi:hypothetical protein